MLAEHWVLILTTQFQWVGSFSPTPSSNSKIPAGWPIIQLHSDTTYPEIASDFTGWGFRSSRLPPIHMPIANSRVVTCASYQLAMPQRFPWRPPWVGWIHLVDWLTGRKKPVYSLDGQFITKDIIENRNQQPDEKIHMARSQTKELVYPWVCAWHNGTWKHCFNSLEALLTLSLWGFMEVLLHRGTWLNHWLLEIDSISLSPLPQH